MNRPEVYDHVEPTNEEHDLPDGVYRVVGSSEERVSLLRVADADGRRINTGEVSTVSLDEFDGFTPAENPDGNQPVEERVTSILETGYWSVRAFVQQLAANPLLTMVAVSILVAGLFGDQILSLPGSVFGVLVFLGSLGLAYIGGGGV